ncbi:ArsR/SmtB family transcription factor [Robertkochia flava]|uniref:ArsR/SmtB family transcription factor n=1 Tax=Robertkochia flava TaxID=3447986 RepID=UPI001CCA68AF|nr:metalloregulator ArsR/SmtB family transcription factor [Robertkochia marina]
MGYTKRMAHTLEQNQLAEIFKAFGHPARIAILQYISTQPNSICTDMVEEIDLAQSTISQHLSELKKTGIIEGKAYGKKMYYRINIDKLYEVKQVLNQFFNTTHQNCY